jgi:hypothetical protein
VKALLISRAIWRRRADGFAPSFLVLTLSTFADVAGFIGAVIILAGFAYHTVRNAAPDRLYHLANFTGASLLAVSLMIHYNLPALCLEVAWAAVALFGLVRPVEKKQ